MIGMTFYCFFFENGIGVGGGGKKLDTFLLYSFILSPFPSDAQHDWNIVRRPVLYTTDLSGTEYYCKLAEHRGHVSMYTVVGVYRPILNSDGSKIRLFEFTARERGNR